MNFTFPRLELPSHSLPLCNLPPQCCISKPQGSSQRFWQQVPIFCAGAQGSCATYPEKYSFPSNNLTSSSKLWVQVSFTQNPHTYWIKGGRRNNTWIRKLFLSLPAKGLTKDLKEQSQEDLGPLNSTPRVKGQCLGTVHVPVARQLWQPQGWHCVGTHVSPPKGAARVKHP